MKILKILLIACLCCPFFTMSQSSPNNTKVHKVWVALIDGPEKIKGYLYSADSISIKVMDMNSMDSSRLTRLESKNIDMLKVRRRGKVFKSAAIGAVSGMVLWGILGLNNDGYFANYGFIEGGFYGAEVGILVGPKEMEMYVRGDAKYYAKMHKKLQYYALNPEVIDQ